MEVMEVGDPLEEDTRVGASISREQMECTATYRNVRVVRGWSSFLYLPTSESEIRIRGRGWRTLMPEATHI
ncbi:unnamed protein product [Nippostrongylus brasiliensis]|uniref:POP1 domain-containing protein n=1 Tax=Nippostrongylus brasiliensis TaxID=27835 RepID=A0A0N4YJB0_NIPBR|nr:unnamed protein product [Nippostrongylus brasiliensis]